MKGALGSICLLEGLPPTWSGSIADGEETAKKKRAHHKQERKCSKTTDHMGDQAESTVHYI